MENTFFIPVLFLSAGAALFLAFRNDDTRDNKTKQPQKVQTPVKASWLGALTQALGELSPPSVSNFWDGGGDNSQSIEESAYTQARNLLIKREGFRNCTYYDSLGKLTIGIGHLVTPRDNIKDGQCISDDEVYRLFNKDVAKAFEAAKKQAREAGRYNAEFIAVLTSVNFQLGTGWTRIFKNTWNAIKTGQYYDAVRRLEQSRWASQTPKRVNDFINVLKKQKRNA